MSFEIKYILIVLVNTSILGIFFGLSIVNGWETKKHLADLDLSKVEDSYMLGTLIISLLLGFCLNFTIFSIRDNYIKESEMETLKGLIKQVRGSPTQSEPQARASPNQALKGSQITKKASSQ